MRKFFILLVAGFLTSTATNSCFAVGYDGGDSWFNPYLGAEGKVASVHHASTDDLTVRMFSETYKGGGLFFGNRFSKHFGLEAGYDINRTGNKKSIVNGKVTISNPIPAYGNPIVVGAINAFLANPLFFPAGVPAIFDVVGNHKYNVKSKLDGWYLDMVGFLPVTENFDIIGSIGFKKAKLRINGTIESSGTVSGIVAPAVSSVIDISERKTIARLGFGGQYLWSNFGVRSMLRFENTGKIKSKGVKLQKDSFSASIAAFIKF